MYHQIKPKEPTMKKKNIAPCGGERLRIRAEGKAADGPSNPEDMLSPKQVQQVVHDLRVHQIELEMQNEELRRVQTEVEVSKQRYFDLYNLAPVGYFTLSEQGVILEANLTATKLLAQTRDALVEKPLSRFILPEDQNLFSESCKTLFRTTLRQGFELRLVTADGSPFWGRIEASLVKGSNSSRVCFAVMSDITERKLMEEKVLRTQRMGSIGTLASGVAHDLNNIITPIVLAANMLRSAEDSNSRECFISSIEKCAQRGADIVNQVLIFARGAEGERVTLPLNRLVNGMEKILRETFPKNIVIESSMPPELWRVNADPTQIQQVILNLCINARDAMPRGGTLLISAENEKIGDKFASMVPDAKAGDFAMLSICDSGTGIPREIVSKIFDPFFTTKEVGKGTGLGLSAAIGIVRSHGGFVTVVSEEGKGSTFKLFLPRETGDTTELRTAESIKMPQGDGETILVVDDEIYIAKMTAMVLERNGYKALIAAEGTAALALYREHAHEIKVVFTDVMMPGMDGVGLAQALKGIDAQVKIVASTGHAAETREAELRALGVNVILSKPFDSRKLVTTIYDAIHPRASKPDKA